MPELHTIVLFCGAGLVILLTPGPAVLYIVNRSVDEGFNSGFVSSLGMLAGGAVHLLGTIFGIAAILAASPMFFGILKFAGAGYLIYLGVQQWAALRGRTDGSRMSQPSGKIFRQAFTVNLLNPKAMLFLFAFLPQFIDPALGSFVGQASVLGFAFLTLALASDSSWAYVASHFGNVVQRSPKIARVQRRVSALIYVALGVATAFLGDWPA